MAAYLDLLPQLRAYCSLLVTGPQRSGTTIAAHILAIELDYRYVDEREVQWADARLAERLMRAGRVVIQCPALCHVADQFSPLLGHAVVMMRRPLDEIIASESRVHFQRDYGEAYRMEFVKYQERFGLRRGSGGGHPGRPPSDPHGGPALAELKYHCWDAYQKQNCISFDLDYASLRGHPLWVEERQNFAIRQWQPNDSSMTIGVSQ